MHNRRSLPDASSSPSSQARRDQETIASLMIELRLERERATNLRRQRDALLGEVKRLQRVIHRMNEGAALANGPMQIDRRVAQKRALRCVESAAADATARTPARPTRGR